MRWIKRRTESGERTSDFRFPSSDFRSVGDNMLKYRQKKVSKNARGFTLIEILVSLTILTIALPPLLKVFSEAGNQSANSANETTALNLLRYKMAELEMQGYPEETGEDEGEFGEGSRFQWRSNIQETDTEGVRLVSVTVNWQERGKEKAITVNTYMADWQMPEEETDQQQGGQ